MKQYNSTHSETDTSPEKRTALQDAILGGLPPVLEGASPLWPTEDRSISLYALFDPETHRVRYIGTTTQSLDDCLSHHMKNQRKVTTFKYVGPLAYERWLRSLNARKLHPLIRSLAVFTDNEEGRSDLQIARIHAIDRAIEKGEELCNSELSRAESVSRAGLNQSRREKRVRRGGRPRKSTAIIVDAPDDETSYCDEGEE